MPTNLATNRRARRAHAGAGLTAIYCRISRDRTGAGLGVERQEAACRALATGLGVTETDVLVYTDNDVSAYSGKPRPGYRAMLAAVETGDVARVIAWHTDRLHRSNAELESFINLIESHRVAVSTVTAGLLDLGTPSGRLNARLVGAVAVYESEHKGERILSKQAANAQAGKWHGGRRRFGYADGNRTPEPTEAEAIRQAAAAVLGGLSLHAVAKAWNDHGVLTATGKPWRSQNVGKLLTGAHLAGWRVYQGAIATDEDGAPVRGDWAPILTDETHRSLVLLLNDPARRVSVSTARKYALTGIARCAVCRGVVRGRMAGKGERKAPAYMCESTAHVHRPVAQVEKVVSSAIGARLAASDAAGVLVGPDNDAMAQRAAQRAELTNKLNEIADALADGDIDRDQAKRGTARVRAKLAELDKAERADRKPVAALAELAGKGNARELFDALELDRRRAVIDALGTVVLHPTGRGGRVFDPATVTIEWHS